MALSSSHGQLLTEGFQFMTNKQFSIEKKDWEHQCALIYQNIHFLLEKIT